MRLIITTYHVSLSTGFMSPDQNPVAIAFKMEHPEMEDVTVEHGRLKATRAGYPVRFLVKGYTAKIHTELLSGKIDGASCTLEPLPTLVTTSV